MRLGRACCDITGAPDARLAGGAYGAASGIDAPLQATVVVVEDDAGRRSSLVTVDLLAVADDLAATWRRRIAARLGIAPAAVLLAASHTHGAPATLDLQGWDDRDAAYCARVGDRLVAAASAALADRGPITAVHGHDEWDGVGRIRSRHGGGCDASLDIVCWRDPDGVARSLWVNVASHPVLMHSTGLVSPDYPGALREVLQQAVGADCPVSFLLGTCGNVNPPAFHFEPAGRETPAQRDAARHDRDDFAGELGHRLLAALARGTPVAGPISIQERPIIVPLDPAIQPPAPAAAPADRWQAACQGPGTIDATQRQTTISIQFLQIGPLLVYAVPLELDGDSGRTLRRTWPGPLLIATVANGYAGYCCNDAAIAAATYEAAQVPRMLRRNAFASGSREQLLGRSIASMPHPLEALP